MSNMIKLTYRARIPPTSAPPLLSPFPPLLKKIVCPLFALHYIQFLWKDNVLFKFGSAQGAYQYGVCFKNVSGYDKNNPADAKE